MDQIVTFLLILLVLVVLIGIPIVLPIWVYRILRKKEVAPKCRLLAFIPTFIIGYFLYDALCPSEEFYEQGFEEVTGTKLTENAEFNFKSASYPDLHGDYTSVSIINVGTDFYDKLDTKLTDNGLSKNGQKVGHR